ncbi:MAG: zinc-dependent alcohol dehydrogenase family protein [Firmicutes bacterium]|nr:zinc-dependent alcohol dehydrogenase family protein [Candidatus Fermentithermobacillaceae bacterium]
MKAMVLHRPAPVESRPLSLQDLPEPVPGPGEVRIKVRFCGVCRTDLHIVEGELPPVRLPLVPGHQVVGVVDAVGDTANGAEPGVSVGDRVGLPWLYSACGRCSFCLKGQENLCEGIRFTGYSYDGGYAQYVIAKNDFVVKLPPTFADLDAAPLLCAGIIGYRSLKVAGVKPGDTVGLFGFGASAHLAIQVARHWGCDVLVFTRSEAHQNLARRLGAVWAGRAEDGPASSCDAAVSFAPAGSVIPAALRALKKGGTLAVNAVHLDGVPAFDYSLLYWEKSVKSVANATRQDAREFMELAAEIPVKVSTQVFSLEEANEALLRLKRGQIQGEAVLDITQVV